MASVSDDKHSRKINVNRLADKQAIEQICQQHKYRWREMKLPPQVMFDHFAWQIAMGNGTSCDDVRHHANGEFTASAYCQARARVPLEVFVSLARHVADEALKQINRSSSAGSQAGLRWHGRRVACPRPASRLAGPFLIDGVNWPPGQAGG